MFIFLMFVGGVVLLIVAVGVFGYFMSPKVSALDFFAVLKSDAWMTGYDITKAIDRLKGIPKHSWLGLGFSTTYRWMDEMQKQGWVERKEEVEHGRLRAKFRLTDAGVKEQTKLAAQSRHIN